MKRALALVLILAACSGGDDDVSKFCATIERANEVVDRDTGDASFEELQDALREVRDVQHDLQAEAPEAIRDDLATMFKIDSDTIRVSEQEQLAEARAKVNRFVRERCDLDFPL